MEMRGLDNVPGNDEANDSVVDPPKTQSLEHTDRAALVPQEGSADERTELYTRLRTIIDTATASIRTLKEENASLATQNTAMSERIGTLEYRIRAVTADLANDELALRQSADVLERVLQSPPTAATQESDASPTPLHASEPERAPQAVDPSAETGPIEMAPTEEMPEAMVEQPTTDEPTVADESIVADEPETPAAPTASYGGGMAEPSVPAARAVSHEEGSYTLIAYPFVRFSDLGQFQAALQKLAGVHDVQVRRFAQGTLEMRIGYTGTTDLATTLRTLATEVEDVQEEEPNRLRVRLRTSQDA
ncbi:MAG: hypothetical protein ACR2JW_05745 [Thermomicrobiales bacterium]